MSQLIQALIAGLATLCVCVIAITAGIIKANDSDNRAMVELVKAGADPIGAQCAVKNPDYTPACVVLAAKSN